MENTVNNAISSYGGDFKELVSTENFRLLKTDFLSAYPYQLEVFTPEYGWEIMMDLRNSDLAELISLIKQYTEEK